MLNDFKKRFIIMDTIHARLYEDNIIKIKNETPRVYISGFNAINSDKLRPNSNLQLQGKELQPYIIQLNVPRMDKRLPKIQSNSMDIKSTSSGYSSRSICCKKSTKHWPKRSCPRRYYY